MGKDAKKEAKKTGYFDLPLTVLHTRIKEFARLTFARYVPDVADAVRDLFTEQDPDIFSSASGSSRNSTFYHLSHTLRTYVEIHSICAAIYEGNMKNWVVEMKIYSENEDVIRKIVRTIDNMFEGGMIKNIDNDIWKKFKKKFKANQEDIIAEWNKWLGKSA